MRMFVYFGSSCAPSISAVAKIYKHPHNLAAKSDPLYREKNIVNAITPKSAIVYARKFIRQVNKHETKPEGQKTPGELL